MATDVPIVQSMRLLGTTTKNVIFQNALNTISQNLKEGQGISQSFLQYPKLFPPLVQQMIAVGEQAGTMEENLEDLATFFEEELELELNTLTVLIEPLLILVIGGVVGIVAFAVIWPMYSLVNQI
jgi:type IV pilus assembly protein PilC